MENGPASRENETPLRFIRLENDLYTVIFFVQEGLISFGRIFQTHAVRDDETWVNLTVLNFFESDPCP